MLTVPVGDFLQPAIGPDRRPSAPWSPRRALAVLLGASVVAWVGIATLFWSVVRSVGLT